MAQHRKRLTLERKYDVNPAYCDSFLRQTMWGFITGYAMSGGTSKTEAIRAYMEFFGVEDDISVIGEIYRQMNRKMRTLVNNKDHIDLVAGILKIEKENNGEGKSKGSNRGY